MRATDIDLADEAAFASWFAPFDESARALWPDVPSWLPSELRALARSSGDATRVASVVADGDDAVVGAALSKLSLAENPDVLEVLGLEVRPARRGEGFGRHLLAHVEALARSHGRDRLIAATETRLDDDDAASERFCAAAGFERALASSKRRLDLPVDAATLAALEADAAAHAGDDYEVATWTGPCPGAWVPGRLALAHGMWTDTPSGELDREPERWDEGRLRDHEARTEAMGRELIATGAVHRASGELVGLSEIAVSRDAPQVGYQYDTIVLPSHRGHRLGLALKVANVRVVASRSPATARVYTWNADDNAPMIAVNDALGYRRVARGALWQRRLG